MVMPRVVVPPLDELHALRQPLTAGERRVLNWFLETLPSGWEIYVQPHLNGLRPDFVLMHPENGVAVYEVKDWSFRGVDYYIKEGAAGPKLMGRRNGRDFSLAHQDPVAKIDLYKQELYGLYIPSLPNRTGFGSIVAGIIFTEASTKVVESLLRPLREARSHDQHLSLYPLIGADLIGSGDKSTLRQLLSSVYKHDSRMTVRAAAELRHWLVEPSFSSEQRVPLSKLMTQRQQSLALNEGGARFRRIKGPAGSGKSLVLAGRAAELAKAGKKVLIITFNITLINYLLDLTVRYAQSGSVRAQVVALNFHHWCRRVAYVSGRKDDYDAIWAESEEGGGGEYVLRNELPAAAAVWAAALGEEERWDAVLVDEGQDLLPSWWTAIRAALPLDGSGEAMLVADAHQNIYGVPPWTETQMAGAGFRGRWVTLEHTYRMSPSLSRLARTFVDRFLPGVDDHRPLSPIGELEYRTVLRWRQVEASYAANECVAALLSILESSAHAPLAVADLVCVVDRDAIGLEVVRLLQARRINAIHTFGGGGDKRERHEQSRRRKLAFYKGDARIKVTTIQSFKGWESRALVVQISTAGSPESLALAYAAITRLKRDDHGCYMTVVCSAPELRDFGSLWVGA